MREVKEYAVREAEFLETGKRLFFGKGYTETSVNDIIQSMGVAKGTFYHYFSSKEDLLDRIIAGFMSEMMTRVNEIVEDKGRGALEKFNAAFRSIRNLKFENIELMIVLMNNLYDDKNILLRHKMFRETIFSLTPVWAGIIETGIREGVFTCFEPLETAELIFAMSAHLNEKIVPMIKNIKTDPGVVQKIRKKISSFEHAISKLLGIHVDQLKIFNMEDFDIFVKSMKNENE